MYAIYDDLTDTQLLDGFATLSDASDAQFGLIELHDAEGNEEPFQLSVREA